MLNPKAIRSLRSRWDAIRTWPRGFLFRMLGANMGARCRWHRWSWVPLDASHIRLGDDVQICEGAKLHTFGNGEISIGDRVGVGRYNSICAGDLVDIGNDCLFSDWVNISDSEHVVGPGISPVQSGLKPKAPVVIGKGCFIGRGVAMLPGTNVGNYCVIGGGALLNGRYPDNSVIVGTPGRVIKTLCSKSST
jgi:acetyltransferase-like isoleucine patch superfamily enzyme